MKYYLAWLPARILYYIGDAVSKIDVDIDFLGWLYQKTMCASFRLDDWGHTNLWKMPKLIKLGTVVLDPSKVVAVYDTAYVNRYEVLLDNHHSVTTTLLDSSVDHIMLIINEHNANE